MLQNTSLMPAVSISQVPASQDPAEQEAGKLLIYTLAGDNLIYQESLDIAHCTKPEGIVVTDNSIYVVRHVLLWVIEAWGLR